MQAEKCLQITSDQEPVINDTFIFNGKFTDLFLYEDRLAIITLNNTQILPLNCSMLFEIKEEQNVSVGFVLYDRDDVFCFQRQFWSRSEEWRRLLLRKIKQKSFHQFFKPIKKIGKGNFASVYLSQDLRNERFVAVKAFVKQNSYKNNGKLALENEMKILRMFDSDNIVRFHGVYETQNSLYFAMEYIAGITLDTFLKVEKQVPVDDRRKIMKGLLNGLSQMSRKGILHRDIKPENVMVSKDLNQVKIVDFGLATEVIETAPLFIRCGTPGYVAPEILKIRDNEPVQFQSISDVFSAGAIFYHLIYGKPLFDSKDHSEVLNLNRACRIKIADRKEVGFGEIELLFRMLEVNPKNRISAAQASTHSYFTGEEANQSTLRQRNRLLTPLSFKKQPFKQGKEN